MKKTEDQKRWEETERKLEEFDKNLKNMNITELDKFTVYAIRQKSTGFYFPEHFNGKTGFSYDNPSPGCIPRIFRSYRSANAALVQWVRGKHKKDTEISDWDGMLVKCGSTNVIKVEGRNGDDMEIVEFTLELKK